MTFTFPNARGARGAAALRLVLAAALAAALTGGCDLSNGSDDSDVKKIAYLRSVATPESPLEQAMTEELTKRGFELGRNLTVLGGAGDEVFPDPEEAEAAVRRWQGQGVDVIVAYSTAGAEIARDHAADADVLFLVNDPKAAGFVTDEQRPEGRMTGVTFRVPADRMLSLARRILPGLKRIGLPYPPGDPAAIPSRDQFAQAAQDQGMELIAEEFSDATDLSRAVTKLVTVDGAQLLLASVSPTATRAIPQLADAAALYHIPFAANVGTAERALLTLSPDSRSIGLQLGRQAARLLNGASPASVPVEDPRRFNIGLSQKVARELRITLPPDVVREADVVRN
jgi:putative tryptophan/tyrosine transport system substrate-binding protein